MGEIYSSLVQLDYCKYNLNENDNQSKLTVTTVWIHVSLRSVKVEKNRQPLPSIPAVPPAPTPAPGIVAFDDKPTIPKNQGHPKL